MLFDPFEEQLHVPTFAVELCYGQRVITKMIGQEAIDIAGGEVLVGDHSQLFRVTLCGLVGSETDNLISNDSCAFVNWIGLDHFVSHVVFSTGYKEGSVLVYSVEKPEEIQVTHIHQIDGPHLHTEFVQNLDIVNGSLCEIDEYGDITSQVKQCVHLDASLSLAELCPWTELQTETDCTAVESVYCIVKIQPESRVIVFIERSHLFNEDLTKVSINAPVAEFVCLCQCVARNSVADATMIKFMGDSCKACLNIPKTALVSILSEAHHKELVVTGEVPDTVVPIVTGNTIVELASGYERHKLGKNGASLRWHGGNNTGNCRKNIKLYRAHPKSFVSS